MTDTPKRGPGRPPKADKVTCEVLRDFWPEGGGRVRKGTIVDMAPMEALEAVEAGAVRRVK